MYFCPDFRIKHRLEHIKTLKYIINWTVGTIIGLILLTSILLHIPAIQKRGVDAACSALKEYLGTDVQIGSVSWRFPTRLMLDDILVYDRQDTLMLKVSRAAAKIEVIPLLKKRIRIRNAQLFGANARLFKPSPDAPHNFQFLIDALSSKDTTNKSTLDLEIGSLLIRRCNILYDQYYTSPTPQRFNIGHLDIRDLNITAQLKRISKDSINVSLKKMSVSEGSGLQIDKLEGEFVIGPKQANINRLSLALPHTSISSPALEIRFNRNPFSGTPAWYKDAYVSGTITARIVPQDMAALVPTLSHFQDEVTFSTSVHGTCDKFILPDLQIADNEQNFAVKTATTLENLTSSPTADVQLDQLTIRPSLQAFLIRNLKGQEQEISPYISRLGTVKVQGNGHYSRAKTDARLIVHTHLGDALLDGTLKELNQFDASLDIHDFVIDNLLNDSEKRILEKVTLSSKVTGQIKAEDGRPDLKAEGVASSLRLKGYQYRNVNFSAACHANSYEGRLAVDDINAGLRMAISTSTRGNDRRLLCEAVVDRLNPHILNLSKKYENDVFSLRINGDLHGQDLEDIAGTILIDSLSINSSEKGLFTTGPIKITSDPEEDEKFISVKSDFLRMEMDGQFRWKNIKPTFTQIAGQHLPSIFKHPSATAKYQDDLSFRIFVEDTALIKRLAGISLEIPQKATLDGMMNGSIGILSLNAQFPTLKIGQENLKHVGCNLQSTSQNMQANLQLERMMKGLPVDFGLDAYSSDDQLHTRLHWNNRQTERAQFGEIDLVGNLYTDISGKQAVKGRINQSNLVINDSIWTIHPAQVSYHDGIVELEGVRIAKAEKYLSMQGRISKEESDSLIADLHKINLAYIFDIINFHAVEFDGQATGRIYAYDLQGKPKADAFLQVSDFTFNGGEMGQMDVHGNWGEHEGSIYLDANINDVAANHQTTVQGTITPGHKPGNGIELDIKTRRCNLYFLNKYTRNIFTDFQGRATGRVRIFGAFKNINVEGDLIADEASLHVNALGVDYHLAGDSIIMRPDNIYIKNATIYDKLGGPGNSSHYATMNGHLMHSSLKKLRYNFGVEAHNILGYDQKTFGDQDFYGTVIATGNMELFGAPGDLNVSINCTPMPGSRMVYNASRPETITDAGFITYVSARDSMYTAVLTDEKEEKEPEGDMRLNFDLNITPDATMRLIMDTKSGDYIDLNGSGHILANYYNKGKFQMYGTYRVDNGIYKLSIQDFIHKDFQFQRGGTLTFGGDAYQAALDLQAKYMVPNVSLDDLSATSLGLSNTRVDCIMNIGGRAEAPEVSFDFDLPNANEDERQMVRSMLNTDEERNMQVIYLLGIGRFYNQSMQYVSAADQSKTAMNSLLSSTLSNQFNQIMSNMLGTNNWSFGANLRTGETGWDQTDVEGILSGRLLSNRLLINGNIGYRESYYSTNNFIGDFDVQYLLTPSGGISLKAYNQTNDRYFIQSSLTTQGIGIQFKKDFNRWKEFFRTNRKKRRK